MARTQDVLDHPVTRAVSGTALIGGVVVAVVISLSALISPLPATTIREPIIVDDAPGLPTDQEPTMGWPAPLRDDSAAPTDDTAPRLAEQDDPTDENGLAPVDGGSDATDEPDSLLDDTVDDVTDTVDDVTDTVDDVTDTVDDVTDTLDDAIDDVTGTVDGLTGTDVTGTVDDVTGTVDDVTELGDDAVDTVTDTVDDVTGSLGGATGGLLP